ncbi:MAG: helix-turn-helix domain-containing protein [Spirochaetales bacterium]|nr:helix-turn-helix domain-containing protein [Spirochaetales bacterium]
MRKEKTSPVPALDKGMKILELLSRNHDFLTMSQIAQTLGYKVSEIQRMVEYLSQKEYIRKNNQKGFYISSKFYALTSRVDIYQILINRASPLMNDFALESQESIQLSVLSDRELRLLVHTEGTRHLRISIKPGMYNSVHTVSGRLLIAYLDDSEQEKFELSDEDHKSLEELKKDYDNQGYWMGESPCFQGIYKLTALISLSDMEESAALTCSFILPQGQKLDEYSSNLLKIFLKTQKLIQEIL